MIYKKPICNCNAELVVIQQYINTEEIKINSNGRTSKRKRLVRRTDSDMPYWLQCPVCDKEYEYEWDKENRVIRGEER